MALYISETEKRKAIGGDQYKQDKNNVEEVGTWPMKIGKVELRIVSHWHDAILMDENEAKITLSGSKRVRKVKL